MEESFITATPWSIEASDRASGRAPISPTLLSHSFSAVSFSFLLSREICSYGRNQNLGSFMKQSPSSPQAAACDSFSLDACPSSCVVCPPCAVCSSIACRPEEFCAGIGFNRSWYEGMKDRIV